MNSTTTTNYSWFIWSLLVYILLPTIIFYFVGKLVPINRAIISLDYILLMCFANIISYRLCSFIFLFLLCLDILVSVSAAYYFNIYDFIYSVKYLSLLKIDLILILLLILVLVLLGVFIIHLFKNYKRNVPTWFSISLLLIISFCDIVNGSSQAIFITLGINYSNGKMGKIVDEKTGKIVDENIASSALSKLSIDVMPYYKRKNNEYIGSKVKNLFFNDISHNFQFIKHHQNIILVIMESFGLNIDSNNYSKILYPILELKPVYNVSINKERFYGGTVGAETKELLGITGVPYYYLKNNSFMDSLISVPKILKTKGYVTFAFHGFSGLVFERKLWWKNIGFDSSYYFEDLRKPESIIVGKAFPGISDRMIIKSIKDKIEVNGYPNPYFIYLLTLNSHLPLSKNLTKVYQISNFEDISAPQIIDSINYNILQDLADLIKVTKNTTVFIVGDHAPPFGNNFKGYYDNKYIPVIKVEPKK